MRDTVKDYFLMRPEPIAKAEMAVISKLDGLSESYMRLDALR